MRIFIFGLMTSLMLMTNIVHADETLATPADDAQAPIATSVSEANSNFYYSDFKVRDDILAWIEKHSHPSHDQLKAYIGRHGWCELNKSKFHQFSDIPGGALIFTKFGVVMPAMISEANSRAAAQEALNFWRKKDVSIWMQCNQ